MADIPAHILDAHSGDPIKRVAATIHRINNHWWNRRIRPTAEDLRTLLDAAEREAAARKRVEELEAANREMVERGAELVIAYHVAINSPKGIVPMEKFYDPTIADMTALSPRTEQEQGDG